jgi:hypothetical protein
MTLLIPTPEQIVILFSIIHAIAVASASTVIFYAYVTHRNMAHIALLSSSYIILTLLVVSALGFRVFLGGESRTAAASFAVIAFILGEIGLWKVWQARKRGDQIDAHIAAQTLRNTKRIEDLERALEVDAKDAAKEILNISITAAKAEGVKEEKERPADDVIKVKLVDEEQESE